MRLSKFSQLGFKILFVVAQNILVMVHKGEASFASCACCDGGHQGKRGRKRKSAAQEADEPEPEPEPEPEVARMI